MLVISRNFLVKMKKQNKQTIDIPYSPFYFKVTRLRNSK